MEGPAPLEEKPWSLMLRLRWPLGGAIAIAFAAGQVLEATLVGRPGSTTRLIFDILGWGALGGLAVWLSLTWADRQERRHEAGLADALREQRELNGQLQRANAHLALLSEANRRIAASDGLDDILDAALAFPRQLVPAHAAALLLDDAGGAIETRTAEAVPGALARTRAALGPIARGDERRAPHFLTGAGDARCLVLPLHDGRAPIGRMELYLAPEATPAEDELALLETIAGEIAEAIGSARRRSREERALYELERAIAEERARIARDIHDGVAQTIAFRRMRLDLWIDWIASDPERLRAELREAKETLREEIRELRRAIFALRPVAFDELGFLGGLHRYVIEFAGQQGWEATVELGGAPAALPPEIEATCFRIVQEALTNAAKHAGAGRIAVTLDGADGGLRVAVRDDGRGFAPGEVGGVSAEGTRVGLRQMHERVAALRGQLTILARPGAGTEIRAWLPLPAATGAARGERAEVGR